MRSFLRARLQALRARRGAVGKRILVRVNATSARADRGSLSVGAQLYPCALGRTGLVRRKREGDGATPAGIWPMSTVLYRSDRLFRPRAAMALHAIHPADGWCDDPRSPAYNRPVTLPFAARHETLWREDGIYDLVVVLAHNDSPAVAGRGSAIFMHLARPGLTPTEGCIALAKADLVRILARIGPRPALVAGDGTAAARKARSRPPVRRRPPGAPRKSRYRHGLRWRRT